MSCKYIKAAALLVSALLLIGLRGAHAVTVAGNCIVNAVAFKESDDVFVTTNMNEVTIPNMFINFTQAVTGCVVLQYTSYANTQTNNSSYITFDLDDGAFNKTQLYASQIQGASAELKTVTYIIKNVSAGDHVLRIKLESSDGQGVQSNGPKVLTLQYRR